MTEWGPVHVYRRRPGSSLVETIAAELRVRSVGRLAAPLALLAATATVAAVVLSDESTSRPSEHHDHTPPAPVGHAPATGAIPPRHLSPPRRPAAKAPPPPRSHATAIALEAQGHGLLQAGRYAQAVPTLERAVAATGERSGSCLDPTTQTCLAYAFALYDLGRALRLSGHPQAAVPILERRLKIANHRDIVESELRLALLQSR